MVHLAIEVRCAISLFEKIELFLFYLGQKGEPGLPGQSGTDGFAGPRVRN